MVSLRKIYGASFVANDLFQISKDHLVAGIRVR